MRMMSHYVKKMKNEMEDINYSITDLERRTYRYLQQLAKSLCLPSNVRKVHLIHLIHAKKFKSETEVNRIIQQVKLERLQLIQNRKNRKRHLQNREVSSTSKSYQSPPISQTPKRSVHPVLRYSPDFSYSLNKYSSRNYLPSSNISTRSISSSDRVLRSFNLKSLQKSHSTINVNKIVSSAPGDQNQATSPKEKIVRIFNGRGKITKINYPGKCTTKRHRPGILSGNCLAVRNENPRQYIISHNPQTVPNRETSVHQPKRQRTLSGIYPLITQDIAYQSFDQIQGVRLRRTDGRLSTINALVRRNTEFKTPAIRNNEISIQEIIDVNFSNSIRTNNYLQSYSSIQHSNSAINKICNPFVSEGYRQNGFDDGQSVYYKKIKSEQVRYQRMNYREPEERLPQITDVFSKFNGVPIRNVTEPLYDHRTDVSERIPSYAVHPGRDIANTHMLEGLYNFKSSLLINSPLLQMATTTNTKCVYTTPVFVTAMVQHTAPLVAPEPFNMTPCEPDNQYRCSHDIEIPHLYELLKHQDPDVSYQRVQYNGDMCTPTSPVLSQSLVTIPEMVEDALEIISQDGDYMERIGMDIRVQCVLCSWAGPKIILEFHIRKEHPTQIHKHRSEWSLVYTLGALSGGLWLSQVLEHDEALCVLSAQYREPDCVVATLCSLSSDPVDKFVTITIYNKVNGEPYTWEGPIQSLPPNLPYENDLPGLTIELSKLDLLPNSANIKLLNKELVLKSPTKVVVGQPELNDIHVILFVRIC